MSVPRTRLTENHLHGFGAELSRVLLQESAVERDCFIDLTGGSHLR